MSAPIEEIHVSTDQLQETRDAYLKAKTALATAKRENNAKDDENQVGFGIDFLEVIHLYEQLTQAAAALIFVYGVIMQQVATYETLEEKQ